MCKTNSENNKIKPDWIIQNLHKICLSLFWVSFACIAIIAICYALNNSHENNPFFKPYIENEDLGQLGDYFGGILNPIISFFALIGLLINLHVQRYEIKKIFQNKKIEKLEEIMKDLLEYYQIIQNDMSKIIESILKKESINTFTITNLSPPCRFRVIALLLMYFHEEPSLNINSNNLIKSYGNFQLKLLEIARLYDSNELKGDIEERTIIAQNLLNLLKDIDPYMEDLTNTCRELVEKINS